MLDRPRWHKSLTDERIAEAALRRMFGLDDPGFCLACGNEAGGVEPDARRYPCEACGAPQVYGVGWLVLCLDWPVKRGKLWPAGSAEGD